MRPRKLAIKNFMPFRVVAPQAHEVDFSGIDLFSITGPMGSGKSALVDAIVWCLYGRTSRYGADSKGVISTGETMCEVALDFTVGERWFRAVRRTGKVTDSGLSELLGSEWIQDKSGAALLTRRVEEILGLDFDSFTKTVILPQGRYAEFLTSEPKKRRELLAKILELGIYAEVADRAKSVGEQARARAETLDETLSQYSDISEEFVVSQREGLTDLEGRVKASAAEEEKLRVATLQSERVSKLQSRSDELEKESKSRETEIFEARKRCKVAQQGLTSLDEHLAVLTQRRLALGYSAERHQVIRQAKIHVQEMITARKEEHAKGTTLHGLRDELDQVTQTLVVQTDNVKKLRERLVSTKTVFDELVAQNGGLVQLAEKSNIVKRWKELRQEQNDLASRSRVLIQKQTENKATCKVAREREEAQEEVGKTLKARARGLEDEERKKGQELAATMRLTGEIETAHRAEERLSAELEDKRALLKDAEQFSQKNQQAIESAEIQERNAVAALEQNRRHHEVVHLRVSLRPGDPCPVCHQKVAIIPGVEQDGPALGEFEEGRLRAARLATQKRDIGKDASARVVALQTRLDGAVVQQTEQIRIRKGLEVALGLGMAADKSPAELLRDLEKRHVQIVEELKRVTAEIAKSEDAQTRSSRHREKVERELVKVGEAVHGVQEQLADKDARLQNLYEEFPAYLSPEEEPEAGIERRRLLTERAGGELDVAEKRAVKAESSLDESRRSLMQLQTQVKMNEVEHRAALALAERADKGLRQCLGLTEADSLPEERELVEELHRLSENEKQVAALAKLLQEAMTNREFAKRSADSAESELQVRTQMWAEMRKREELHVSIVEEARKKLRETIEEQGLSEVEGEGKGVQSQMEAVHGRKLLLQEQLARLQEQHAEALRRATEKNLLSEKLSAAREESLLAFDLRKLLGSEFTDYLSRGAIETLMLDASGHLQGLTHGRYEFDIGYRGRAITIQIVDHEDHGRARPTHSLSGGETFLASLAIALALSQGFRRVATGRAAQTSTECLIIDEGFGSLDREGVQMVTETLQQLRGEEGRMVGIITHVEEVAAAMPTRIEVQKGGSTSQVRVAG